MTKDTLLECNLENTALKDNVEEAQKKRIEKFRVQKNQEKKGFYHTAKKSKKDNKTQIKVNFDNTNLKAEEQRLLFQSTIANISGTSSIEYGRLFIEQSIAAFFQDNQNYAKLADIFTEALIAMNPQDIVESQLCGKLILLNNQKLYFMAALVNPNNSTQIKELNLNFVTKLTRLYNETLDTLIKYRRKEQKITVQHININSDKTIVSGSQ